MAPIRIILHGKAASDSRLRTAVSALRKDGQIVEVRVTWEPGDAARLTGEAVAEAGRGKIDCIVAGGGDGTINEVFATAWIGLWHYRYRALCGTIGKSGPISCGRFLVARPFLGPGDRQWPGRPAAAYLYVLTP